ncbi:MAG: Gfo/Idh/MocA family oxidoreductase [Planctomicrobium sp.]|nr:Gfo/Idh/MocA family oxidoreductase [Planctomicrobium sp.]
MSKTSNNKSSTAGSASCNRREFLENSARNAAGLAAGTLSLGATRSPNERLQIGVIGLGSQGLELAKSVARNHNADVIAICDVDVRILATAQHELGALQKHSPVIIPDYEALVNRSDVDAVIVSTPDHWHSRMASDTLQAKKDLFLETPIAHSIAEGQKIAELASQSRSIVQVGLPQRSGTHFQSAVKLIRSGYIGEVHLAKAWASHRRKSIGRCATSKPPVGVDYTRWLGPAPTRNFQANRFHQTWSWFWDYGSGELGLWGVQQLDVIRWALNLGLPSKVFAKGGKHSFKDDRETPDTLTVHYDYPEVEVVWEHRQWSNRGIEGRSSGVAFYGDSGTLIIDRSGWKVYDHTEERFCDASEIKQTQVSNFLNAVRDRTEPVVGMAEGQASSIMCHLGNMAFQQGRELVFNAQTHTFS